MAVMIILNNFGAVGRWGSFKIWILRRVTGLSPKPSRIFSDNCISLFLATNPAAPTSDKKDKVLKFKISCKEGNSLIFFTANIRINGNINKRKYRKAMNVFLVKLTKTSANPLLETDCCPDWLMNSILGVAQS